MQRLKTRAQFQAALAGGTIARTPHFALHCLVLPANAGSVVSSAPSGPVNNAQALFPVAEPWLGAMVPKRWARRAVTRNAIKRQIYNVAIHAGVAGLPSAAYVVRLRAAFDRQQFISAQSELLKQAVRAELVQLFARAVRHSGHGGVAPTARTQP
ncbi:MULTISPECIES: ribonuclease P protein component [Giesbergeria]|uniref:Ribonuclease P protein component n=1 Tax=Giesbergeria sinuosa TaxID=80883 RepID=A0ABV9QBW4_9BURK